MKNRVRPGRVSGHASRLVNIVIPVVTALLLFTGFRIWSDELAALARGIELFSAVFREIVLRYAEPVDPSALVTAGIRGMLGALDPYTTFIDDKEKVDVDMLTSGSYSGVGASISGRGGRYLVSALIDSVPYPGGLHIGDEILRIDSLSVKGQRALDLRNVLRGPTGTRVAIEVQRPGMSRPITLSIPRHDIPVHSLSVAEKLENGCCYLRLDRFTRTAAEEIREALLPMFSSPVPLRGVILDLRDNPGGLLDAAVDVTGLFVARGSLIVSTKGRNDSTKHEYYSSVSSPLATLPVVVLINGNSASASEIVAGAIQDLDRGVILGQESFGKGLVQTIVPLGQNASLKLTTARYFTPSGRCIQRVEYGQSGARRIILSTPDDTSRHYRTLNRHRSVHGRGGIEPDETLRPDTIPALVSRLTLEGALMQFVASRIMIRSLSRVPPIDREMQWAFQAWCDSMRADTLSDIAGLYRRLSTLAERNGASVTLQKIRSIADAVRAESAREFERDWPQLRDALRAEFAFQLGGKAARFREMRASDRVLSRAFDVLANTAEYGRLLTENH